MSENNSTGNKKPLFVIDPAPTIRWPVEVTLPVDGGETVTYQFTGIFNRLSNEALDALLGVDADTNLESLVKEQKENPKRAQEVLRENAEIFPKLLVGWEDVKTSDGKSFPFSVSALQQHVTGPNGTFLSIGIWRAVNEIRSGARLGN